jgi:hypothetical protein
MNQIKKNGFLFVLGTYNCDKFNIVDAKYFGGELLEMSLNHLWSNKSFLFTRRLLDRKVIKKLSYSQQLRQQDLNQLCAGYVFERDIYVIKYIKQ